MVYNEVAEDEKQGKEGMNMNPVIVRNVRIGEGMPKICVPVVGRTRAEIREAAAYVELNRRMSGAGYIDMVDVEMFSGDDTVSALVRCAHACQVKVVGSNHDFQKTPAKEEIVARLRRMQELDADILKIAVMLRSKKDVLTLLAATEEMCSEYANRPVITMSMDGMGVISRLCGEAFGSAVTFGSAGKASAPTNWRVPGRRSSPARSTSSIRCSRRRWKSASSKRPGFPTRRTRG